MAGRGGGEFVEGRQPFVGQRLPVLGGDRPALHPRAHRMDARFGSKQRLNFGGASVLDDLAMGSHRSG